MSHRRNATPNRRFLSSIRRIFAQELLRQLQPQRRRSIAIKPLEDRSLSATVTWNGDSFAAMITRISSSPATPCLI